MADIAIDSGYDDGGVPYFAFFRDDVGEAAPAISFGGPASLVFSFPGKPTASLKLHGSMPAAIRKRGLLVSIAPDLRKIDPELPASSLEPSFFEYVAADIKEMRHA